MEVPATVHETAGFVTAQEHFAAYCRRREVMPYRNMQQYFAYRQRWGIPYIYMLFYGVTVTQSLRTPDLIN
jgi:hypothetical protein